MCCTRGSRVASADRFIANTPSILRKDIAAASNACIRDWSTISLKETFRTKRSSMGCDCLRTLWMHSAQRNAPAPQRPRWSFWMKNGRVRDQLKEKHGSFLLRPTGWPARSMALSRKRKRPSRYSNAKKKLSVRWLHCFLRPRLRGRHEEWKRPPAGLLGQSKQRERLEIPKVLGICSPVLQPLLTCAVNMREQTNISRRR